MRVMLGLFLCLLFSPSLLAQSKSFSQIKREVKAAHHNYGDARYDKATDTSTAAFMSSPINGKSSLWFKGRIVDFGIIFHFKGEELKASVKEFTLFFSSYAMGTKPISDTTLYVLADGENLEIPVNTETSKTYRTLVGRHSTLKFLQFVISRPDLEKLANAKNLQIKFDEKTYAFDSGKQQIFKDTLKISEIN